MLGTILGDLANTPRQLAENLIWLTGVLMAAFVSLDHDRYRSWERDAANGQPLRTKRLIVGVITPDILCLLLFGLFQWLKVN